jgi:hypothetical protein
MFVFDRISSQNNVLVTGGEDSKLNVWSGPSLQGESELGVSVDDDFMDVDSIP